MSEKELKEKFIFPINDTFAYLMRYKTKSSNRNGLHTYYFHCINKDCKGKCNIKSDKSDKHEYTQDHSKDCKVVLISGWKDKKLDDITQSTYQNGHKDTNIFFTLKDVVDSYEKQQKDVPINNNIDSNYSKIETEESLLCLDSIFKSKLQTSVLCFEPISNYLLLIHPDNCSKLHSAEKVFLTIDKTSIIGHTLLFFNSFDDKSISTLAVATFREFHSSNIKELLISCISRLEKKTKKKIGWKTLILQANEDIYFPIILF